MTEGFNANNSINLGTIYRARNCLLRPVEGLPLPVWAGGGTEEEDGAASTRPVETGGSPRTAR